ncbi:ABC transporter ATP-binding protein [Reinekea marinisedimentorum]|uniref:ATP-binding cassette, subfamily B, MsbA n=1 Tax=Reinekea marinisedimentorum TaxID=230495 RepID=A0A4R3IC37_9GAMM|nr:ABC transporter ATP-binding protein [Reinekea marinisedimentorum]TCS43116.1 ATP-binding cassette, subfamily B, MsbA [Reinekea marinisedimentorum]
MSEQASSRQLLSQLWHKYVKKHRIKLTIAVFFMLLEGAAYWVFVNQLRPLFDSIFVAGNEAKIWGVALAIFGVFMVRGFGSFIHRSLTAKTGIEVVSELQQDLTGHLLKLDMDYFNKNSPGGLIERVRGDTQALQAFASTTLITLGRDLSSFVALLIAAINIDATWTAILFVGVPLLILPMQILQRLIRNQSRKARQASANLSTRLDEIFHGIKAIKLNNLADHENERFADGLSLFVKRQLNAAYSKNAMLSTIEIVAGFGFVAIIYFGGQEIIAGEKTAGEFITFFVAIAMLLDPLRRLASISGAMQGALANLERIQTIFVQTPMERPEPVAEKLNNPLGDICFDNVTFSYGDVPVLKNLSFVAPGGKTTAFVGPSGAGKSTLFNLLTHLEIPAEGNITIGGQNINTLDASNLRKELALVNQESALFDESILDNIKLGDVSSDPDKVVEASQVALVSQFADEMPEGLHSLAGPRGSNLSGGQRQRVIIARALLRDAPILLLDEATSALDNQTEKRIQALLNEITANKTTLVIAHRLTTVMNSDLIHVMQDGRIVESGTHAELMALNGHYKALHATLEK